MPLGIIFWSTLGIGGMRELERVKRVDTSAITKNISTRRKRNEVTKTMRLLPSPCQRCMKISTTSVTFTVEMQRAAARCPPGLMLQLRDAEGGDGQAAEHEPVEDQLPGAGLLLRAPGRRRDGWSRPWGQTR